MRTEVEPVSRKGIFILGAVGFLLMLILIGESDEPPERTEVPVQADNPTVENRLSPPVPGDARTVRPQPYTPPEAASLARRQSR